MASLRSAARSPEGFGFTPIGAVYRAIPGWWRARRSPGRLWFEATR